MEVNLNNNQLKYTKCLMSKTVYGTEKTEIIIPDSVADVDEIVGASFNCFLKSKECGNGNARLTVSANGTVILIADGKIRKTDFAIPVTLTFENSEIRPDSQLFVWTEDKSVSVNAVNPRKLSVSVTVAADCMFLCEAENTCTYPSEENKPSFKVKKEKLSYTDISAFGEKQYVISDELKLDESKKPLGEILFSRSDVSCDSIKTVGTKAIINCTANTFIVYSSADDGSVDTIKNSTRYTQIVELSNEADEDEILSSSSITGIYMNSDLLASSDERRISMELHVITQCMAMKRREFDIVSDIFSTKYKINTDFSCFCGDNVTVYKNASGGGKALLSCEDYKSLLSVYFSDTSDRLTQNGEIVTSGKATLLYLDDRGNIKTSQSAFEISSNFDEIHADNIKIKSKLQYSVSQVNGGAELSIAASYCVISFEAQTVSYISKAEYDENELINTDWYPSFVIKKVSAKVDLWTLSKENLSDESAILSANSVQSEEELMEKGIILIPKVLL